MTICSTSSECSFSADVNLMLI